MEPSCVTVSSACLRQAGRLNSRFHPGALTLAAPAPPPARARSGGISPGFRPFKCHNRFLILRHTLEMPTVPASGWRASNPETRATKNCLYGTFWELGGVRVECVSARKTYPSTERKGSKRLSVLDRFTETFPKAQDGWLLAKFQARTAISKRNVWNLDIKVSIGQAAKALGVSRETLRRWEAHRKITVERTPKWHRRYDLARLHGIMPRTPPSLSFANHPSLRPRLGPARAQRAGATCRHAGIFLLCQRLDL